MSKDFGRVVYAHDNPNFIYFNERYLEVCSEISKTLSIRNVRRMVSTFIYEFSYSIIDQDDWQNIRNSLAGLNHQVASDSNFTKIMEKEDVSFREEVQFYPIYYKYFLNYLSILGEFMAKLSATYLPRTSLRRAAFRYINLDPFYKKLHEFKGLLFQEMSKFSIERFRLNFNIFITFYYAHKLFISQKYRNQIEVNVGKILGIFINSTTIDVLSMSPDYSTDNIRYLEIQETRLHFAILHCISLINQAFSDRGINPKIEEREYGDKHLI